MSAGRALVDAGGQIPHAGDAIGDLLAKQHPAAARLRALANHHLDRICLAQAREVHTVA